MRVTRPILTGQNLVSKYLIGSGISEHTSSLSSCRSHNLMLRTQLMAPASATGVFNILPLGLKALEKLCGIINAEMSRIGSVEVRLACLSSATPWKMSKRWEKFGDEMMRLSVGNSEHSLNPTHEEAVTSMVASTGLIPSNNLPLKLHQISTKFRDEPRPKFGLLRCREFLMKDLYTFDKDVDAAMVTYHEVCEAYERIFKILDLNFIKAKSLCGNIGGITSHEYLIPAAIGDDKVCIGENGTAWNSWYEEEGLSLSDATVTNAIEIGHAFLLGTLYSDVFNANFIPPNGKRATLQMGCYGLGVTRILACCVEMLASDDGIRWPFGIAPFKVCIIPPKLGSKEHKHIGDIAMKINADLNTISKLGGEVIIDDRTNRTIGKRLLDAKLVGYPLVIVIGKHILDDDMKVEIIFQNKGKSLLVPISDVLNVIAEEVEWNDKCMLK